MPQSNRPEASQLIYAQVVVRPDNGDSLLSSSVLIDSKNVSQFHAASDRVELVVRKLKEAGFEVLSSGKIAITIAGLPEVFERVFQTTLETVERPVIKELGQNALGTFFNAIDSKPFGEIDVSHTSWHQFLDGVAINEPVYYFESRLPSPIPPSVPKQYLSVPEGVARGLNAHLAHQQGITGKGIHVVMVDSGWYRHSHFTKYNYDVNVHLANGSSDRDVDLSGHGTGESANLLAIAPDIKLTMVKADVAICGKGKNVNSVGALREAIALKPDIISCSWGSDERTSELSPYNRVLAATVAEAIHQGIIVVFSAGNGQYGFPAQHPEVIAVGGAYLHLNGSLQGKIEASSYASSFISPIYGDRQVPDVCGLVGNLPYGSYIMLPVSPNSLVDQQLAVRDDGTEAIDGWAAFSGTSAAAPQLAGICALMKQVNPNLSPAQARQILRDTAHDVVDGSSNPATSGASARAGPDLATGHGLADAYKAVNAAKSLTHDKCCDNCASQSSQNFSTTSPNSLQKKVSKPMTSEFPKLKKNLEQVQWKLNEKLSELITELSLEEDIELILSESNFVSLSPINRSANVLRGILDECFDKKSRKITRFHEIDEEHIYAAQGLLKLGKYSESALDLLIAILGFSLKDPKKEVASGATISWTDDEKKSFKTIRKLASDILSECRIEINNINSINGQSSIMMQENTCTYLGGSRDCYTWGNPTENCTKPPNARWCM
jgi:serine protease AprX